MLKLWMEEYLSERDVSVSHAENYRRAIRFYSDYVGYDPTSFDHVKLNQWLTSILERGKSRDTARCYRSAIAALWRWCEEQDYCDANKLRRLKKIRPAETKPIAITPEEVVEFVDASTKLRGVNVSRDGEYSCPYSTCFPAMIIGAYCLGFRRGDIWSLERAPLLETGTIFWTESKTKIEYGRKLSKWGQALLAAMPDHRLAYPWFRNKTTFSKQWRRLVELTGIEKQFKHLRCSFVTITGWRHEDPSISKKHYIDKRLLNEPLPTMPEIAVSGALGSV